MYVSDFYADAKRAFEGCDEDEIFRRLSSAVRLLNNNGIADVNLGEIEACVCNGCLTLPRDVGTVLGIDVCGRPTLIQDQWFKYHINGPGARAAGPCGVITEMGQVCTFKDPAEPAYLIAEVTSAADNNKMLRVFATDVDGKKIFTQGMNGGLFEGFVVPMIYGYPQRNPNVPALGSIYRISRAATKDFVKLYAVRASDGASQTLIGQYEPDETEPTYRRIRVPNKTSVMVKFKKADLEVRSQRDWINCDNHLALQLACRAVRFYDDDKYAQGDAAISRAVGILNQQIEAQRPAGPRVPQIINGTYQGNDESLLGGYGCGYGGSGYYGQ